MDFFNALYFSYFVDTDLFRFEPTTTPSPLAEPSTTAPTVTERPSTVLNTTSTVHHKFSFHGLPPHSTINIGMGAHYSTVTPSMHMTLINNQNNDNQNNGTKSNAVHHVKVQHHASYWIQLSVICAAIAVAVYLLFLLLRCLNKRFGCCTCCFGATGVPRQGVQATAQVPINAMEMGVLPPQPFAVPQPGFNPQQIVSSPLFQAAANAVLPGAGLATSALTTAATAAKAALPPRAASVAAVNEVGHRPNPTSAHPQNAWAGLYGAQNI